MFLEIANQQTIHYLGIPYIVENLFRGRFLTVTDAQENEIENFEIVKKVLNKYQLLNNVKYDNR